MKAKKLEYDHQLGDQLGELHKPLYTLLIEQEKLEKIDLFEGQVYSRRQKSLSKR